MNAAHTTEANMEPERCPRCGVEVDPTNVDALEFHGMLGAQENARARNGRFVVRGQCQTLTAKNQRMTAKANGRRGLYP